MKVSIKRQVSKIPGWMTDDELEWLADAAQKVNSWTEIGSHCGRSMLCVGLNLPKDARLTVVDFRLGEPIEANQTLFSTYKQLRSHRQDLKISLVQSTSVEAAEFVAPSDIVFIDANHYEEHVRADISAWRGKTNWLCGHDYSEAWPDVVTVVDELLPHACNVAGSIWSEK